MALVSAISGGSIFNCVFLVFGRDEGPTKHVLVASTNLLGGRAVKADEPCKTATKPNSVNLMFTERVLFFVSTKQKTVWSGERVSKNGDKRGAEIRNPSLLSMS